MKKIVPKILALMMVVAIFTTCLVGCSPKADKDPVKNASYVNIDINPNIDLVVDTNNKVISVVANNDDAEKLLLNAKVVGKNVDDAVDEIIRLSFELNYISTANDDVKVVAFDKAGKINENLQAKLVSSVNAAAKKVQLGVAEAEKVAVKVIDGVSNSWQARLDAYKQNVAESNADAETKQAVAKLTVGKFMLVETVVTMSNGTIKMETAVQMDMTELNRYLYELNQKCDVIVEGIVAELEKAALEIQKQAQDELNKVYNELDKGKYRAVLLAKNAYVGAQETLSNIIISANDTFQKAKEYAKTAPTTRQGQTQLDNMVYACADELFNNTEEGKAAKQIFLDSMKVDGRFTYESVLKGFDKFYNNYDELDLNEHADALANFYRWFDTVHQDVYKEINDLVVKHFNGAKAGITSAVRGYVTATNAMNKVFGLPEIAAPTEDFKDMNEMVDYVSNMLNTQNANVEKAFADYVDRALTPEQKAEIDAQNKKIKGAYEKAREDYLIKFAKGN